MNNHLPTAPLAYAIPVGNSDTPAFTDRTQDTPSAALELWLADLAPLESSLEQISLDYPLLTETDISEFKESEKHSRLRMRRTARMVLRFLLLHHFGALVARQKFTIGPYGKPMIPGLKGDFNLAHAGGFGLIGLGTVPSIGVDLEPVREVRLSPSRRATMITAGLEVAHGKPLPKTEDFRTVQAWTRLEALAKAEGQGIGRVLARYGIWGASSGPRELSSRESSSLLVHDLPVSHINMQAAVCLPIGTDVPKMKRLPTKFEDLLSILLSKADGSEKSGVDLEHGAGQNSIERSVAQPG